MGKAIKPKLRKTFNQVYNKIKKCCNKETPDLFSTGGTLFKAKAKITNDGRKYIALPHNNRIYEHDWGYVTNHMGKSGQRIRQYSIPLDDWT